MGCGASNQIKEDINSETPLVKPEEDESSKQLLVEHVDEEVKSEAVKASPKKASPPPPIDNGPKPADGTWFRILSDIGEMALWEEAREDRPAWARYLQEAESLMQRPRKPLPKDLVDAVMKGDLGQHGLAKIPNIQNRVVVFISSTFTDTQTERNMLMKDVYPYMRTLCHKLGLDFGTVDMRWGVTEATAESHGTTQMCLNEVERCKRESAGPAFLAIVGDKYGFRPFPATIPKNHLDAMMEFLKEGGDDVVILEEQFQLDTNQKPAHYVLKPKESNSKEYWAKFETITALLRKGSEALELELRSDYYVSVTEAEIKHGVLGNEDEDRQVICTQRHLAGIESAFHKHRRLIDLDASENIDEKAQEYLKALKDIKIRGHMGDRAAILEYDGDLDKVKVCIRSFCDQICEKLTRGVLDNYKENMHKETNSLFGDILQHRSLALDKSSIFVGRNDLLDDIADYIKAKEGRCMLVLHGQSGCGKTAIMAVAAQRAKAWDEDAVTVVRFIGTTGLTSSARQVLASICSQVTRAYGKDVSTVPTSYKDLIKFLPQCLSYARSDVPLFLFLDSLDQLSDEDFGKNLKWLSSLKDELPEHVKLVLSTLPGKCKEVLDRFLPPEYFVHVKELKVQDGPEILRLMLEREGRTLTQGQEGVIIGAFKQCPLPLYMRLAADMAQRWHCYDAVSDDDLAPTVQGLIDKLFERLERTYGKQFVHRALAYITAAKNGLAQTELEDILSCDDVTLDEVFAHWTPPVRRIPQLLWIRIRNELGIYLSEKGADGATVYSWYHRQFWEAAERRFLDHSPDSAGSFRMDAHLAIADYFSATWLDGKMHHPTKPRKGTDDMSPRLEPRQVPRQPFVYTGDRQGCRQLNRRKLRELPYHLVKMQDWERFESELLELEFIEAKFEAEQGFDCISELREAATRSGNTRLKEAFRVVGSGLSYLLQEPDAIYQIASQQNRRNTIRKIFERHLESNTLPRPLLRETVELDFEDPCEMTLQGHTSAVRCCDISPNGDVIVSGGEDGTLRVWDAVTGSETFTLTDLPGPTYPACADPYHGERPCCFNHAGDKMASGSEDGGFQIWDLGGSMILSETPHRSTVTAINFSPDDRYFITGSRDTYLKVWDAMLNFALVKTINTSIEILASCFNPNGLDLVIAGCGSSVAMLETSTWRMTGASTGYASLNLCVAYAPDGSYFLTGGDDSSITVWKRMGDGQIMARSRLTAHRAWIWCIKFGRDGKHFFSCSSDRSLKLWNAETQTVIATVGGHNHRVTCVTLLPGMTSTFVTSSLDGSLKVWNYDIVLKGDLRPVQLHYRLTGVSPDGKYLATTQGWNKQCNLYLTAEDDRFIANTAPHGGIVNAMAFSGDSTRLATLDVGHLGAHEAGSVTKAIVAITNLADCTVACSRLNVVGPRVITYCGSERIAVGTHVGEIIMFDARTFECLTSWHWQAEGNTTSATSLQSLAYSTSCRHLAGCVWGEGEDISPLIKVWESGSSNLALELTLPEEDSINNLAYSPDGSLLAASFIQGLILIWSAKGADYTLTHTIRPPWAMNRPSIHFSHQGRYLATGSADMNTRVWDVRKNFEMVCAYYGPVNVLDFKAENELYFGMASGEKKLVKFLEK